MTIEQLQAARAEKWRQKANPVLTLEDAEAWIGSTGISLFLPRKAQLQTPAPSFVEAVSGETNPTPNPAAIQNAFDLAVRLTASGAAIPLNLFGAVSEQPDFLASQEALPFVFALRGDREWKRGPRDQSAPLVVESWKTMQREGALTAPELQDLLGREITEGAVLRVLAELWTALRVLPVYTAGEPTTWELFESNHQKAAHAGGGMAQATALSALISLYLESVIAATSDEVETFLSPLAPRSRIREAARGLAATRQLGSLSLAAQTMLFIAGGLPEFPEIAAPVEAEQPAADASPTRERRKPFAPRKDAESRPGSPRERKPFTPGDRPRRERPAFGERPAAGDERRPFKPRTARPAADGPRKEWQPRREGGEFRPRREASGGGGFNKPFRKQSSGEGFKSRDDDQQRPPRKEWKPRTEGGGDRREFRPRPGAESSERRTFRPRDTEGKPRNTDGEFRPRRTEGAGGFKKPYRTGGENRPAQRSFGSKFPPRDRDQQRPPRKEWKPRTEGAGGERREFRPRRDAESSERRTFRPRDTEGKPRNAEGEFRPRRTEGAGGFKKPYRSGGENRPGQRSFGSKFPPRDRDQQRPPRKEWKPRTEGAGGERREFRPRPSAESSERRTFRPRDTEGKPRNAEGEFRPRRSSGGFGDRPKPAGERRSFSKKPFEGRERSDGKKPPQRERSASGFGAKGPGVKRAGKSFSKPGGKPAKKFGAPKGGRKPAFGAKRPSRPGGKPSFGKRPGKKKTGE